MTHNFYLYNNPETSKLTWIPWDNNEALQEGNMGGSLNLDFSDLESNSWPLIAKIYADEVYKARYNEYLLETISDVFDVNTMQATYDNYSAIIEPYTTTEVSGYSFLNNANDFYQAIEQLKSHAESRTEAISIYFDNQD
jgi:spore coat protein CotH